jgi:hypothetical protein
LGDRFVVAGASGEPDHQTHGITDRDCRCSAAAIGLLRAWNKARTTLHAKRKLFAAARRH